MRTQKMENKLRALWLEWVSCHGCKKTCQHRRPLRKNRRWVWKYLWI